MLYVIYVTSKNFYLRDYNLCWPIIGSEKSYNKRNIYLM